MRTLLTAFMALGLAATLAAAPKARPAGVVLAVSGEVSLYHLALPHAPRLGQTVFAGDRLRTGNNGRLALALTDGTQLKLNYNTDITLRDRDSRGRVSARGIAAIKIFLGELWARVTKKASALEFDTPAAVAAVKGTEPLLSVGPDGSLCVRLRSGAVRMSNGRPGSALLEPNEQICVSVGGRISQSMVQPWNGGTKTWEQGFGQATSAGVTVQYVDQSGLTKSFVLNYSAAPAGVTAAAGPGPAPQGKAYPGTGSGSGSGSGK